MVSRIKEKLNIYLNIDVVLKNCSISSLTSTIISLLENTKLETENVLDVIKTFWIRSLWIMSL